MSAQLIMNQTKDRLAPRTADKSADQSAVIRNDANSGPIADNTANYSRVLEVSHRLHSSLNAEEILRTFSEETARDVAFDGLIFVNATEQMEVQLGEIERHTLGYTIMLHGQQLGQLQFSRQHPFSEAEITTLEDFTTALVYPLHNAFSYAQAVRSSFQDPLTGLSNRAALQHDLERECALARRTSAPLSLLLLDIDHFKSVNDNWGHQSGDQALKTVATTINNSTRGSDMLYRYGGEEFLILLASTPAEGAQLVAERIRKNIEQLEIDSVRGRFSITGSIGVATLNDDDDSHSLVRRADEALYRAKHAGRNRVHSAQSQAE